MSALPRLSLLVIALAALAVPPDASATPIWNKGVPQAATSTSIPIFPGIACPSPGVCVTAGVKPKTQGATDAVLGSQRNGEWGPLVAVALPPDAAAGGAHGLSGIACKTATDCFAVGYYSVAPGSTKGLIVPVTISGGGPVAGAPIPFARPLDTHQDSAEGLTDIACTASTCTTVGTYRDAGLDFQALVATDADWTGKRIEAPAAAEQKKTLHGISCPASGPCVAVGTYRYENANNDEKVASWTVELTGTTAAKATTVAQPADASSNPGQDFYPGLVLDGLSAVSCPVADSCSAVGTYAQEQQGNFGSMAVPITNGTPGAPIVLAGGGGQSVTSGVACWTAADCLAVGLAGVGSTAGADRVDGIWSSLKPIDLGLSAAIPLALSCFAPEVCTMVGFTATAAGNDGPVGSAFFATSVAKLALGAAPLPAATLGQPYSATLQASGGSGAPKSWAITSGALPAGLTLNASTGVISGTPTDAGSQSFGVTVTDAGPPQQTAAAVSSITVQAPPPKPTPEPTSVVSLASVTPKGAGVRVVLFCQKLACSGRLELSTKVKKKKVLLAKAAYAIAVQRSQTVKLVLTGKAAKLLAKQRKLKATLAVIPFRAKKPSLTRTVKLKAPKRK